MRNRQDGITVIEFLVVVLVVGILAAIALPTFLSHKKNNQHKIQRAQAATPKPKSKAAPFSASCSRWVCDVKLPTGPREPDNGKVNSLPISDIQLDKLITEVCKDGVVEDVSPLNVQLRAAGSSVIAVTTDLIVICGGRGPNPKYIKP